VIPTRLVSIAMIVITSWSCGGADAAPRTGEDTARIPVRVVTPELRDALPPIVLTGTLGAKEEIPLAFKVGGVLARIAVEPGQVVREGDVLAELSMGEIDAQVSAAREARDKAHRDFTRAERLFADSIVTTTQFDDARTARDVTEAQHRAAEFNRQYAVVRAPADGIVLRRHAEPAQLVAANATIVTLRTDRRGLVLRAAAADKDAVRIKPGTSATVTFDAFPDERFRGRVERVGISATPGSGTYEVEISVAADAAAGAAAGAVRMASGLIGRASITVRSPEAVVLVPAESLLEVDGDTATIFIVEESGDQARRATVRVTFLDGPMAAITGGLPAGARVVTAGATRLSDGTKVTVSVDAGRAP
jgi:multidrug efflux system membrane fusion protein